jgi:hypothetical protein
MKAEKQQTAVEWLYEHILLTPLDIRSINKCLEQAKEMEKEQIINAREDGFLWGMRNTNNFYADKVIESEQYYNETFNKSIKNKG